MLGLHDSANSHDWIYHTIEEESHRLSEIDIRREVCPMTFVRTRIALDRLPSGATLRVTLQGDEPRRNVPKTAAEQGHSILSVDDNEDGSTLVVIRRR